MPVINFTNNTNNSQEPTRFTAKNLSFVAVGAVIIFVIAIGVLLALNNNNDEKASLLGVNNVVNKTALTQISDLSTGSRSYGEVDLPVVNQTELKQNYQNNLKEIIADLDKQIQSNGGIEKLDIQTIQEIKSRALSEVLPKGYQAQHLDFVLTMDLLIGGNFNRAQKNLQRIKQQL
jgi:hypothetical protein